MAEKETGWREIDHHPVYLGDWPKFHGYEGGGSSGKSGKATNPVPPTKLPAKGAKSTPTGAKGVSVSAKDKAVLAAHEASKKAAATTPAVVIEKKFLPVDTNRGMGSKNLPPEAVKANRDYLSIDKKKWDEKIKPSLTGDEEYAVDHYTGSGYMAINTPLWKDPRIQPESEADDLLNAIDKAGPTNRDLTLYRNMHSFPEALIPKVGETATMNGFLSTAVSPQSSFVSPSGVAFEIHVPKGSKGLLGGMNVDEKEFVVKHGAKLRYLGEKEGVKYGSYANTTHFWEYQN